ncbi:hypothetical protein [Rubritalea sp.]|uniref:hypothetical protein n=1 Tax=Rubritalea sp. TaxID=2109375 RepID=UPI003EF561A7
MNTKILYVILLLVNPLHSSSLFFTYVPDEIVASDALGNPITIQLKNGFGSVTFEDNISNVELSDVTDFSFSGYITSQDLLGNVIEVNINYDVTHLTSLELMVIDKTANIINLHASKDFIFIPAYEQSSEPVTFIIEPDLAASLISEDAGDPFSFGTPSQGVITIIPEPSISTLFVLGSILALTKRSRN